MVVSAVDGTEGGGADRRAVNGGRHLDEATLPFGAEHLAVAAYRQHVAVMQDPVEDRGGDHGIGEHGATFGNAAVRRDPSSGPQKGGTGKEGQFSDGGRMPSKSPRKFSRELKLEAVSRILDGEQIKALSQELTELRKDLYS